MKNSLITDELRLTVFLSKRLLDFGKRDSIMFRHLSLKG